MEKEQQKEVQKKQIESSGELEETVKGPKNTEGFGFKIKKVAPVWFFHGNVFISLKGDVRTWVHELLLKCSTCSRTCLEITWYLPICEIGQNAPPIPRPFLSLGEKNYRRRPDRAIFLILNPLPYIDSS